MNDTVSRNLSAIKDRDTQQALNPVLRAIADRMSTFQINSAALAGTAVTVPSTGAVSHAICQGVLRSIPNAQAMAALAGTVVNATFNVFVYYINMAGTFSTQMGTAGATLAAVRFPEPPFGSAVIGYTLINPTGTGNFVGGTTNFNDATVVPNAVHVNVIGAFDPTIVV